MASSRTITIDPTNITEEHRSLFAGMLTQNSKVKLFSPEASYASGNDRIRLTQYILHDIKDGSCDCYRVFSSKDMLGKGVYGAVFSVPNTLRLRKDGSIRSTSKPRVVKISIFSGKSQAESKHLKRIGENESAISKRIPYLHVKDGINVIDRQYLVMRALPGRCLVDGVEAAYTLEKRLQWSINMAKAVLELHRLEVIHRDVKLDNMMLDELTDSIKLIDFGFSILAHETDDFHGGSLLYAAPEICRRKAITKKTDIFALGICLHLLWGASVPDDQVNALDLLKKRSQGNEFVILTKKALLLCMADESAAEEILQLLNSLVAFHPDGRPNLNTVISLLEKIKINLLSENEEEREVLRAAHLLGNAVDEYSSSVGLSLDCFLLNLESFFEEKVSRLSGSPAALKAFNSCHQIALLRQVKAKEEIMPLVTTVIDTFKSNREAVLSALEQPNLTEDQTGDLLAMLRKFNRPRLTLDDMARTNDKAQTLLRTLSSPDSFAMQRRG